MWVCKGMSVLIGQLGGCSSYKGVSGARHSRKKTSLSSIVLAMLWASAMITLQRASHVVALVHMQDVLQTGAADKRFRLECC